MCYCFQCNMDYQHNIYNNVSSVKLVLYHGDPESTPSEGLWYFLAMLYFVTAVMS